MRKRPALTGQKQPKTAVFERFFERNRHIPASHESETEAGTAGAAGVDAPGGHFGLTGTGLGG